MKTNDSPKVIINEDYIDLRDDRKKTKPTNKISSAVPKNKPNIHVKHTVTEEEHYSGKEVFHDTKNVPQYTTGKHQTKLNRANKLRNVPHKEQFDSRFRRQVDPVKTRSSHSECTLLTDVKSNIAKNCSSPAFKEPSVVVMSADTEEKIFITSEPNDTLEKGTMTEYSAPEMVLAGEILDIDNTLLSKEPKNSITWPDSRIIQKYPNIVKLQKYRRSFTEPCIDLSFCNTDLRCSGPHNRNDNTSTYVYDEGSDVDSAILLKVKSNKSVDLTHHGKALLGFFGTVCGILLVSAFLFILLDKEVKQNIYFKIAGKQEEEYLIHRVIKIVSNGVLSTVSAVFMAIYRIMTIPTGEVLGHTNAS